MGASRENRPSENTVSSIATTLLHLNIQVWYPMKEEALETISWLREKLDTLEKQLNEEAENK